MRSGVRTVELKDKKAGFKQVDPYAQAFALPVNLLVKTPKAGEQFAGQDDGEEWVLRRVESVMFRSVDGNRRRRNSRIEIYRPIRFFAFQCLRKSDAWSRAFAIRCEAVLVSSLWIVRGRP